MSTDSAVPPRPDGLRSRLRQGRRRIVRTGGRLAALAALLGCASGAAADTSCRGGKDFASWLAAQRQAFAAQGVGPRTLAALDGLTFDPKVFQQDRGQPSLSQSFLDFADRTVTADRLKRGRALLARHGDLFATVERQTGVPGPVILALWSLETDYGAYQGRFSSLRSLATLAYDCRRPDYFGAELLAALRLIQSGDLRPAEMVGAWAGELGQVQFTPSNYARYAVDGDGDGRRDLVASVPDVVASAANYLKSLGWRGGEPWLEEVRVAPGVPWAQAARGILHPRSFWAGAGVTRRDGSALSADAAPASLILPMGRLGPAFLAGRNFSVFWDWNQSSNYILTAAYLATRIAGAPALERGSAPAILPSADMRDLQERLNALGYQAGEPDGRLGETTRAGVKPAQARFGLAPDGYPTRELLKKLRGL